MIQHVRRILSWESHVCSTRQVNNQSYSAHQVYLKTSNGVSGPSSVSSCSSLFANAFEVCLSMPCSSLMRLSSVLMVCSACLIDLHRYIRTWLNLSCTSKNMVHILTCRISYSWYGKANEKSDIHPAIPQKVKAWYRTRIRTCSWKEQCTV